MGREILFRGKRIDDGNWVEGNYVYFERMNNACMYYSYKGAPMVKTVEPETVCQYTGLTDKNGRKIFEGDIVETVYDGKVNPNYVVVWDSDELGFKATNGKEHYKTNYEYLGCCEEIIVIGNIFDNPELLREYRIPNI